MQDGDLSNYLKAQGGQLLPEDAIMLHFVQICLAIQYIHSKVSSIRRCRPHTPADPFQTHIATCEQMMTTALRIQQYD